MDHIPHEPFLEIGTSLQFLASLSNHYSYNQDATNRCLRSWKAKYDVSPLAGPNLAAVGWMIVVRWFELVKVGNSEFPSDLLDEMNRRAAVGKFDMQNQSEIEKNYSCTIKVLEMDDRDKGIFLGSFIRHFRNAISHYDIHHKKDAAQNLITIIHTYRGKEKLHMDIDPVGYFKLVGDLGILFQESAVELDLGLQSLIKSGPGLTP